MLVVQSLVPDEELASNAGRKILRPICGLPKDLAKGNSWAHPVVVNGKLYLREQDKLMCYQVGK